MRKNIIKVVASALFAATAIVAMGIFAIAFTKFNIIIVLMLSICVVYATIVTDYNDNDDVLIGISVINGVGILALLFALFFIRAL
jgi:hypothetical protein